MNQTHAATGLPRTVPKPALIVFSMLLTAVGVIFALAAPVDLVTKGPFGWHIRQPAFWQGGIELIVLAALIGASLYALKGWFRILAVLVLCELYARRQGVDLAILISLFYFEGIAALGTLILNRLGRLQLSDTEKCLFSILLGTLTWSCVEWILSALGPGSVRDLQIAALVVLGGSLLSLRRLPVLGCVFSHVGRRNASGALLGAFVCTVVLMLFAKASVNLFDYDALWYGLRGDRVLVAAGSVFHGLGLVTAVHYVPQAYELLQIPLNGLGSVTAILGFSIWCWVALAVCLYAITERLQWAPKVRLLATSLALAIPAVLNVSLTAKGTVMAAIWVFFGVYSIIRHRLSPDWRWLLLALVAAMTATNYRESALVYAVLTAAVACCLMVAELFHRRTRLVPQAFSDVSHKALLWFGLGAIVLFGLVTARTFLLTGIPYYGPATLMTLAERVGLSLRFPVGGPAPVHVIFNTHLPHLLYDYIFRPGNLWHVRIEWTGSAFAYFLLVGIVSRFFTIRRIPGASMLWSLALTFPALLFFLRYLYPGGDGNYFIEPVISMTLLGIGMLGPQFLRKDILGHTLNFMAGSFLVIALVVSLVTGLWGPGTRAWDFNFSRPALDFATRAEASIRTANLQTIDAYFRGFPPVTRVVGVVPFKLSGDLPGSWLPVRYESLRYIQAYAPNFLESVETTEVFLRLDGIQYVLLPLNLEPTDNVYALTEMTGTALQHLQARGLASPVVDSDHYVLWKLKD